MTPVPNQPQRRDPTTHAVAYISDLFNLATKEEVDRRTAIAEEVKRRLDVLVPVTMRQPRTANEIIARQNQIAERINSLVPAEQQ